MSDWNEKYVSEFSRQVKLKYGMRDGKIISIYDIPLEQRGLKCDCICPLCGMPLQARLGEKNQWHFAHHNTGCDIMAAQRIALIMLAKEIIENNKKILLPGLFVNIEDTDFFYPRHDWPSSLKYRNAKMVCCESVKLEKRTSSSVPNIVINVSGRECLIEIAITRFTDRKKQKRIEKTGLPAFEINLSSVYGMEVSVDEIKDAVLNREENRKWLFNPLYKVAVEWANEKYKSLLLKYENEKKQKEIERQKLFEEQERKIEKSHQILKDLLEPSKYKSKILEQRNDKEAEKAFCNRSFYSEEISSIPFYMDIPVTGEVIFKCDRRIWQSKLFDKFIFDRAERMKVCVELVERWLLNDQNDIELDDFLVSNTFLYNENGENQYVTLLYAVIKNYFDYLSFLGFISNFNDDIAIILEPRRLSIPHSERAGILIKALETVDQFDPNIDDLLQSRVCEIQQERIDAINRMKAEERKREFESSKLQKRKQGSKQIREADYDSNERIVDEYGYRWLLCTVCGQIYREDDMSSYGGRNSVNKGVCRNCSGEY